MQCLPVLQSAQRIESVMTRWAIVLQKHNVKVNVFFRFYPQFFAAWGIVIMRGPCYIGDRTNGSLHQIMPLFPHRRRPSSAYREYSICD